MGQELDGMFKLLAVLPPPTREAMVRMYCESLQSQIGLLGQSLAAQQGPAATATAHKIAGSAAMMQDEHLSRAARTIETALREGRLAQAEQHWPRLQECAAATLQALRQAYPGVQ